MLNTMVLKEDLQKAEKEMLCAEALLVRIKKSLQKKDIQEALLSSIDLTKSIHELNNLTFDKRSVARGNVTAILEDLHRRGIEAEEVRRFKHGR